MSIEVGDVVVSARNSLHSELYEVLWTNDDYILIKGDDGPEPWVEDKEDFVTLRFEVGKKYEPLVARSGGSNTWKFFKVVALEDEHAVVVFLTPNFTSQMQAGLVSRSARASYREV